MCDCDRPVGLLRIEDLIAARPDTPLRQIMDPDPPTVTPGTDQEIAAWKAARHGESSLAVIDGGGRFVGLIPPHRLLAVLLAEHNEDMTRLGGYLGTADPARAASEEPVRRRLWHRLPWLLLGLVGAMLAAWLMGAFEAVLTTHVMIAFFSPTIVYMADAVGTQTETLVIRGLSLGVPLRRIARRELRTGLLIGVVLAGLFLPLGLLIWRAMSLPWALARAGMDPAFGSGPLATVIQTPAALPACGLGRLRTPSAARRRRGRPWAARSGGWVMVGPPRRQGALPGSA